MNTTMTMTYHVCVSSCGSVVQGRVFDSTNPDFMFDQNSYPLLQQDPGGLCVAHHTCIQQQRRVFDLVLREVLSFGEPLVDSVPCCLL